MSLGRAPVKCSAEFSASPTLPAGVQGADVRRQRAANLQGCWGRDERLIAVAFPKDKKAVGPESHRRRWKRAGNRNWRKPAQTCRRPELAARMRGQLPDRPADGAKQRPVGIAANPAVVIHITSEYESRGVRHPHDEATGGAPRNGPADRRRASPLWAQVQTSPPFQVHT